MLVKMQETLSSIGVKKDLPFTKFLNYELNKLRESGILQNILVNPKENCPLDENPKAITFSKMVFLFAVFVLGGILSILIFILERTFSKKKDATFEKNYGNQRNMIKGGNPKTNEIGVQCNMGKSVVIGRKNITSFWKLEEFQKMSSN